MIVPRFGGPEVEYPMIPVALARRESSRLVARARYNQRGVWMSRRAIQVP